MSREFEVSEDTFLMKWTVEACEAGLRLDRFLKQKYRKLSREVLKRYICEGRVALNHQPTKVTKPAKAAKPSRVLRVNDTVYVLSVRGNEPEVNFDYQILFEDKDILVINKPANLPMHPSGRYFFNTLLTQLRIENSNEVSQDRDYFVVHRIDRETSGVVVLCKNKESAAVMVDQFCDRVPQKEYLAIVRGNVTESHFRITAPLARDPRANIKLKMKVVEMGSNGRPLYLHEDSVLDADTEVFLERQLESKKYSVVRVKLHTGRQHQIRIHMEHAGYPLAGDKLYGAAESVFFDNLYHKKTGILVEPGVCLDRHALHAAKLSFPHPRTSTPMEFSTDLPEDLEKFLEGVGGPKSEN